MTRELSAPWHRDSEKHLICHRGHYKILASFDFQAQPSLNKLLITELLRSEYLDKKENILWVENSGTGMRHIATALGIAAWGQGKRVKLYQVKECALNLSGS